MRFSNTEFYYTDNIDLATNSIIIQGEEAKHAFLVMRHSIDDELFITNGKGNVFKSIISSISKSDVKLKIVDKYFIENYLSNVVFFVPILKFAEKMEFALEKCVELGITNFKVYSADKSHKRGIKIERWQKILHSAMKQSLQSYLPSLQFVDLSKMSFSEDKNFILEQNADESLVKYFGYDKNIKLNQKNNFFFGPEAGLTQNDIAKIYNPIELRISEKRLRSETAIISAASIISSMITH